ncbi:MAG TPA: HAD-IIIC family phosphatase [Flavisolibacter sp.]|nr:HAD-IIIC family phosphatase [Flavisolibacter sp.]
MQNLELSFNQLIKAGKQGDAARPKVRIAILAEFASQHLVKALKAAGAMNNLEFDIWEADYDAIDAAVLNESSALYEQPYDYIVLYCSVLKLYKQFSHSPREGFGTQKLDYINNLVSTLQSRTKSRIIVSNYPLYDDAVFGNYANKTSHSFLYQLRTLNVGLMDLAAATKNVFIVDAEVLAGWKGRKETLDPKLYIHADIIYTLDFLGLLAQGTASIIATAQGSFKKCVILDLDNTTWGGIIGDDGIENIQIGDLGLGKAFTMLQLWVKNLKDRGIIVAVSSKNTEEIAKEVFLSHPQMVLRMDDIAVFAVNWETKVDNIRFIQSVLNIGFDSMVFLDDNPFERAIVRENIEGITVPELPEDPAEYLSYLQSLNLFETTSFTEEDAQRTKQYQEEAGRTMLQKSFTSEAEFLDSLSMVADVKEVDRFSLPRVAQLTQRSNQFNLRTVRYTEEDVKKLMADPDKFVITVSLKDKFGDYGLISCVFLEKQKDELFINNWIMSCRVLKRGVENLVLNEVMAVAKEKGLKMVVGEYLPTAKNALVKDHYKNLGFEEKAGKWFIDPASYQSKHTNIKKRNSYAVK